jgi:peptide/nickel transport system substrate-binding protein
MTADDVVFTFNHIMDPKINAPRQRAYYNKIARVEKTGDNRVTFYYREPYFEAFELAASLQVLPRHFYEKIAPETFNESTGLLMGSGPYKLESASEWKPGDPIEVIRNERYWGVSPPVDRIVWRVIPNDVARLTAFRNGEVDLYGAPPEAYVKLKDDPAMAEKANRFEYFPASGGYRYVAWNQMKDGKPTPFADVNVRRALAMAINRQRMMEEITLGYANLTTGPFSPLSKQYDKTVEPIPYDLEKARKMLADAGYTDRNNDGVVESPAGEAFRFKLTYPTGIASYERQALFIKDALGRAGVVMEADPLEWSVFQDRLKNKNFDAITLGWTSGIETDIFQMFHSSQMMSGGDNFMSYKSAELDSLIDKARVTLDEEARMKLWQRAHQILNEDQPYMFLWFGKSLVFVDKRFANVRELRLGLTPRTEWYVPSGQQRWTKN